MLTARVKRSRKTAWSQPRTRARSEVVPSLAESGCCSHVDCSLERVRRVRTLDQHRAAAAARVRAAAHSGAGLHLDPGILGLRSGRLFLGARHVGPAARGGFPVDARLLGLGQRTLCMECGLLGPADRLLRWRELRLRLPRVMATRAVTGATGSSTTTAASTMSPMSISPTSTTEPW